MTTADGLQAILQLVYSAAVGASARLRGAAASLIGKLHKRERDDLPELLFEAFAVLLNDPFVYVHITAIDALERFREPERFTPHVRMAVFNLISSYATNPEQGEFLAKCVVLFANRYATPGELSGGLGRVLIELLKRGPGYRTARELRWLARQLGGTPGFVDLVLHFVKDPDANRDHGEGLFEALAEVPEPEIQARGDDIVHTALAARPGDLLWTYDLIELLTAKGAFAAAEKLAQATYDAIPDTEWERPRRLSAELALLAVQIEARIASGRTYAPLTERWRQVIEEKERDRIENAERRDPLRGLQLPGRRA